MSHEPDPNNIENEEQIHSMLPEAEVERLVEEAERLGSETAVAFNNNPLFNPGFAPMNIVPGINLNNSCSIGLTMPSKCIGDLLVVIYIYCRSPTTPGSAFHEYAR